MLGDRFGGVLVSDFYAAYNHYPGLKQRCWVHLLRDIHELKTLTLRMRICLGGRPRSKSSTRRRGSSAIPTCGSGVWPNDGWSTDCWHCAGPTPPTRQRYRESCVGGSCSSSRSCSCSSPSLRHHRTTTLQSEAFVTWWSAGRSAVARALRVGPRARWPWLRCSALGAPTISTPSSPAASFSSPPNSEQLRSDARC